MDEPDVTPRLGNYIPIESDNNPARNVVHLQNIVNRFDIVSVTNMLFANSTLLNDVILNGLIDEAVDEHIKAGIIGEEELKDNYLIRLQEYNDSMKRLAREVIDGHR